MSANARERFAILDFCCAISYTRSRATTSTTNVTAQGAQQNKLTRDAKTSLDAHPQKNAHFIFDRCNSVDSCVALLLFCSQLPSLQPVTVRIIARMLKFNTSNENESIAAHEPVSP